MSDLLFWFLAVWYLVGIPAAIGHIIEPRPDWREWGNCIVIAIFWPVVLFVLTIPSGLHELWRKRHQL
jgi:hypothetical protein